MRQINAKCLEGNSFSLNLRNSNAKYNLKPKVVKSV